METIFETLRREHDQARTLMSILAKTHGDSTGRRELFAKLKRELDEHAHAEERSLYKHLIGTPAQGKATHSIKEHEEMKDLLEELEETDFSNPGWLSKFGNLREMVEHHMDEEEHGLFQLAGRVLEDSAKRGASRRHQEVREALQA